MARRGGGRGKSGDGYGYQRDNNFPGNRTSKRDNGENPNKYFGGENRQNFNRERGDNNRGGGFRKFSGTNSMSSRGYKSGQRQHFNSRNYNNQNHNQYNWVHNQTPADNHFPDEKEMQIENHNEKEQNSSKHLEPVAPVKQPVQNNDPPILLKMKTEKLDPQTPTTKSKNKAPKAAPKPASSSESASEKEDTPAPKIKTSEVLNPVPKIKIKREQTEKDRSDKKQAVKKAPSVPKTTAPPPPSESSSSDSSSSSSSEDEEPEMPPPMKGGDVKPKKEKKPEDDVVCLGKMNKIENLADSDDPTTCVICNKQGHSSDECQMKCKTCSHSSYQCQMVCKNCGETYTAGVKSMPKPPNPLVMFMQFMQFCMSQYDMFGDVKHQFPPCNNPVPVPEPTPTVEVSRKDIENSKTNRKRSKSESKQKKKARKNSQKSTEDDSDSSSVAASSSKKRKKRAKSITRERETTPPPQQQQNFGQHFGQTYPSNLPFAGSFNSPGYNPMMAFSQMMGYNPVAMNFKR